MPKRIRKSVGTAERPRCVCIFGQHVYAQVVDDDAGKTLIAGQHAKDFAGKNKSAAIARCGNDCKTIAVRPRQKI